MAGKDRRPVHTQMPRSSGAVPITGVAKSYGTAAPFDRPQDTGNGGIPTVMRVGMGERTQRTVAPALASPPRTSRPVSERRFPMGGRNKR